MPERLGKPSLMDEDDDNDEEMSNFGKRSNRFLKSKSLKDKPKDDFQKELHDRVNSNRSATPRSIDTDSDLGIDNHEENDYLTSLQTNQFSSKNSPMGGSGWQPSEKKSPRKLNLNNDLNNSIHDKNLKEKSRFDNKSVDQDKKQKKEDYFNTSSRELRDDTQFEVTPRVSQKGDSALKKKNVDKNSRLESKSPEEENFLKTLRYKDSDEMSNMLDTINKKQEFNEKSKKSRIKFSMDEDEDDFNKPSTSSRFMKTQKSKSSEEKLRRELNPIEDNLEFHRKINSPRRHDLSDDENRDHQLLSSTKFLKSSKPKSPEEKFDHSEFSKEFQKEKSRQKPSSSKNNFELDDDDDESYKSSSSLRLKKSPRSKTTEEKLDKSETLKHSKRDNKDSRHKNSKFQSENDSFNEFLFSQKLKDSSEKFGKSESPELGGYTKFLHENSNKNFNAYDLHDAELNNSTKLLKINHSNEVENSSKTDIKPKPRKSYLSKNEFEDGPGMSKTNLKNTSKDDIKRRSIRFEDEMSESFSKSIKDTSRESSPRKSDISRQSSGKNTPSPPTSICEEVIQDPITLKFKALQKRREEKKREKESQFESNQSKVINESINTVADSQHQKEPIHIGYPSKKSNSRPTSAKYKNIQPKITTRINIKSLKSPSINNDWSSTPDLHGYLDDINSERSFTSSQTIRDTAYLQWYLAKLSEKNLKKQTDNSDESKKKATDEERLAAYIAWKNAKKEYFLELDHKRKEEEKKKEAAKIPVVKDRKSAELAFEVWKKQKEQKNKEEAKKKADEKKQKELTQMKEREEKQNKKSELLSEWEIKKAKEKRDKEFQTQKEEKLKQEAQLEKKQKLVESERAYRLWEEKADLQEKKYSEFEKNKEVLINNRRAWRPSTNSVMKTRRF